MDNAVSYVEDGGTIEIGTEIIDGALEVSFQNSGCLLSEGDVESAFERFWRVRQRPQRNGRSFRTRSGAVPKDSEGIRREQFQSA